MSLAEAIEEKEAELRQIKDHEVSVVFDALGNIALEVSGVASSVDLSPYLDQIRSTGAATLVHNHPLGWQYPPGDARHAGSSFSPEDIRTACFAELTEIRAVGPRRIYSMSPSLGSSWSGSYWIDTVQASQEKHTAAVKRSTLQLVKEGSKSREAAEANFWNEVWSLVVNDVAIVYRRFEDE